MGLQVLHQSRLLLYFHMIVKVSQLMRLHFLYGKCLQNKQIFIDLNYLLVVISSAFLYTIQNYQLTQSYSKIFIPPLHEVLYIIIKTCLF